jgi:hypothetical protein
MSRAGTGPIIIQWCCIGLAILGDKSSTIYPRWVGFLSFWLADGDIPAQMISFVNFGPFAYRGLFGFRFPTMMFVLWVATTYWYRLVVIVPLPIVNPLNRAYYTQAPVRLFHTLQKQTPKV